MLIGAVLGTQIARQLIAKNAPPQARALIMSQWIKIANTMCKYFQANAEVILPPMTLLAPPGAPPLSNPTVFLGNGGGPVVGSILIPPKRLKVV